MEIHVAYTIDIQGQGAAQFIDQLKVSIKSAILTKRNEDSLAFHVHYANAPTNLVVDLTRMSKDGVSFSFAQITQRDLQYMQQFSKNSPNASVRSWSGICYARLWLARSLPNLDKVLYLDADTMVRGSLHELWETDLQGKMLGMAMGCIPEYGYNSGVILMDLKKMRSDDSMWLKLEEHMKRYSRNYFLPDQTTINRFFKDEITELPTKFNYPPIHGYDKQGLSSAVIWHFYNGGTKPTRFDDAMIAMYEWNKVLAVN